MTADAGLIGIAETARLLGLSPRVTYRLAEAGELPGLVRLDGHRLLVRRAALTRWMASDDGIAEGLAAAPAPRRGAG